MLSALREEIDQKEESRIQEMIQCRQRQWNSGLCKDRYCEGCTNEEACFELFGG